MPTDLTAKLSIRPPIAITGDLSQLQDFLEENRERLRLMVSDYLPRRAVDPLLPACTGNGSARVFP